MFETGDIVYDLMRRDYSLDVYQVLEYETNNYVKVICIKGTESGYPTGTITQFNQNQLTNDRKLAILFKINNCQSLIDIYEDPLEEDYDSPDEDEYILCRRYLKILQFELKLLKFKKRKI